MVVSLATAISGIGANQPPASPWVIRNVMRWTPLVLHFQAESSALDPAWILGLIAQESMGEPDVIGSDRVSPVGLMQIAPFAWRPSTRELLNPGTNIRWGMGILEELLNRRGDIRWALAAYNCGETGVAANRCGRFGGYAYADKILGLWVPIFRDELRNVAIGNHELSDWVGEFYPNGELMRRLQAVGYGPSLGEWDQREGVIDKLRNRFRFHVL